MSSKSVFPLARAAAHRSALVPPEGGWDPAVEPEPETAPKPLPQRGSPRPYRVGDEHPNRPKESFVDPKKAASWSEEQRKGP